MIVGARWTILPDWLATRALSVAAEIAARLRRIEPHEREGVEAAAGCALLHGQLDDLLPDQDWAVAAHGSLALAVRIAERSGTGSIAMFGGLTGLATAAHCLSHNGSRYRKLLAGLDATILPVATARAEQLAQAPAGLAFAVFDVISGLAGTGAYLLARGDSAELRAVLTGLVALCEVADGLPNWHTPFDAMAPNSPMGRSYPTGVLNAGLSHGVPGPMALLALALRAGVSVPGQQEATERVAHWLAGQRIDDEWGPNWAAGVALPDASGVLPPQPGPTHNAWCYGSPGVARALWHAGMALDDDRLRALAVDAMAAVYRRSSEQRGIDDSPGLCHGVAGLLQITLRFAWDTGEPLFVDAAIELTDQLVGLYRPEHTWGYRFLGDDLKFVDRAGLLDGAAGVALTLLSAAAESPTGWDRMLLLS